MHTWLDLLRRLPGKDCGRCGNPTCRSTARRIAAGKATPDVCVNLAPEQKKAIEKLLKEGVSIGSKSAIITEEGVTIIHPCTTDQTKVAAETKITHGPEGKIDLKYGFIDPYMMCYWLGIYEPLKNLKCSPATGTALFEYDGKKISAFANGKINVREAKDNDDVLKTVRLISRVLWGAMICSCCGNVGQDCASGSCTDCLKKPCRVISNAPGSRPCGRRKVTSVVTLFERLEKLEGKKHFLAGMGHIDSMLEKQDHDEYDKANRMALEFITRTERGEDAAIGLILSGVALDIKNAVEANQEIKKYKPNPGETQVVDGLNLLLKEAYTAFKKSDPKKGPEIIKRVNGLKAQSKKTKNIELYVQIQKLANQVIYLARLLPKPIMA